MLGCTFWGWKIHHSTKKVCTPSLQKWGVTNQMLYSIPLPSSGSVWGGFSLSRKSVQALEQQQCMLPSLGQGWLLRAPALPCWLMEKKRNLCISAFSQHCNTRFFIQDLPWEEGVFKAKELVPSDVVGKEINSGLQPFTKILFSWLPKWKPLFSICFFHFLGFRILVFLLKRSGFVLRQWLVFRKGLRCHRVTYLNANYREVYSVPKMWHVQPQKLCTSGLWLKQVELSQRLKPFRQQIAGQVLSWILEYFGISKYFPLKEKKITHSQGILLTHFCVFSSHWIIIPPELILLDFMQARQREGNMLWAGN